MENHQLNLKIIELKTFIPAKNFDFSTAFYTDIGFSTVWNNSQLALFDMNGFRFLLQRFYVKDFVENFVMHLLVSNADDWWTKLNEVASKKNYDIHLTSPEDREWGVRDFTFSDPSGVLWRVGNTL
jgi:hypothetical protein